MNDKGFTLIEIVAIMVILVGLFLVSFPVLNGTLKSEDQKKYNNMVNDLCTAGKPYKYSNMDKFPELSVISSEIELKISELISYGNIDKNLINPKSKLSVEDDILKYIVLEDLSLDCQYIEE